MPRFSHRILAWSTAGLWLGLLDGYIALRQNSDIAGPGTERLATLALSMLAAALMLILALVLFSSLGRIFAKWSRFEERHWTLALTLASTAAGLVLVAWTFFLSTGVGTTAVLVGVALFAVLTVLGAFGLVRVVARRGNPRGGAGLKRVCLTGAAALVLCLVAPWVGWAGPGTADPKTVPNVVLISVDTLRADHLSAYGYGRETTPKIDALARDGVLFENAFSQAEWTLPSHSSMLTGLDPLAHRVLEFEDVLSEAHTTLAELLQSNGYRTGAFVGGNHYSFVGAYRRFDQGFERYHHYPHPGRWRLGFLTRALDHLHLKMVRNHVGNATAQVDAVNRWIWRHQAEPFFLFLHFFDVHSKTHRLPYEAPAPFRDKFCPDYSGDYDGCGPSGTCASELYEEMVAGKASIPTSGDDIERMICLYDGGLAFVDHELGRLFDVLKAHGLYENTIIVFTSDHGEAFFEHGIPLHANLYDEVLQVPLIVKAPALASGTRVQAQARVIDIMPTILDLAGAAPEAPFQGGSLVRFVERDEAEAPAAFAVGTGKMNSLSLRTHRWKYILNLPYAKPRAVVPPEEELYDLQEDPAERRNRMADPVPEIATELKAALLEREEASRTVSDILLEGHEPATLSLPEAERERLRALGYIQ